MSLYYVIKEIYKFFHNELSKDNLFEREMWLDSKSLLLESIEQCTTRRMSRIKNESDKSNLQRLINVCNTVRKTSGCHDLDNTIENVLQEVNYLENNLLIEIKEDIIKIFSTYLTFEKPTNEFCACIWKAHIQREFIEFYLDWKNSTSEIIKTFNQDLQVYNIRYEPQFTFRQFYQPVFEIIDLDYLKQITNYTKYIKSQF
jgi:hypothetical protein